MYMPAATSRQILVGSRKSAVPAWILSVAAAAAIFAYLIAQFPTVSAVLIVLYALNAAILFRHAVRWLRGQLDSFDPLGLLTVVSPVFFLLSPVTQIANSFWLFIPSLTGEYSWFYIWGILNFAGIIAFEMSLGRTPIPMRDKFAKWEINPDRFKTFLFIGLAITFAMQLYIFAQYGGISGFLSTFSQRQQLGLGMSDSDPFEDMGAPMLIAESFKFLFAMAWFHTFREKRYAKSMVFFAASMLVFLTVFLIFGGLRGSRSSTVFSLLFAAGIYHFWVTPLRMRTLMAGALAAVLFTNVYYWYKVGGIEGLQAMINPSIQQTYDPNRVNSDLYFLTRDMGRMDVQVLAMREFNNQSIAPLFGPTYLTSVFAVIPKTIIPWKPPFMNRAKTDITKGEGNFEASGPRQTTIVLGLFGEAFINFSYPGVILAFAVLGWITRKIRRLLYRIHPDDARRFFLPVLCLLPLNLLIGDSGLGVVLIVRALLIPAIVLVFSVRFVTERRPSSTAVR